MIPGPGPSKGQDCPGAAPEPVVLVRTARGWLVHSSAGTELAGDLVEGLSLADLVAEESGAPVEPDRSARRSVRGRGADPDPSGDPVETRVAELERTVAQLEHALAARVSTAAIGVPAERHGASPRAAFETLRGEARSQGLPVAELAREVLEGLDRDRDAARTPVGPGAGAAADGAP